MIMYVMFQLSLDMKSYVGAYWAVFVCVCVTGISYLSPIDVKKKEVHFCERYMKAEKLLRLQALCT